VFQTFSVNKSTISQSDLAGDRTTTGGGNESTPQANKGISYSTLKQNMTVTTDSAKDAEDNNFQLRVLQAQFEQMSASDKSQPNIVEDRARGDSDLNSEQSVKQFISGAMEHQSLPLFNEIGGGG